MEIPEKSQLYKVTNEKAKYDLSSILCSPNRDYLIRNNGDQVKANTLKGKIVGLYFSVSECDACHLFTPRMLNIYSQLRVNKFEIVLVSCEDDNESFDEYFTELPWLAIPFSDSETRQRLQELFRVNCVPHLVLVDQNGELLTAEGVEVILEHGAQAYPFTPERFEEIEEQENKARLNQSLKSLLVSNSRDYVLTSDGNKVPVAELEGKTIGLYFVSDIAIAYDDYVAFNAKLVDIYKSLKDNNFEIVMVREDDNVKEFEHLPWISLPVKDKVCAKLIGYFKINEFPSVVVIGPDGKTLHTNVVDAIKDYGIEAYPFTPKKLEEVERAKREAQTLESILASSDCDFVIGKDSAKIPVSDLIGKNILLYFSAQWCTFCQEFQPTLIQAYHEINKYEKSLEVIFISSDMDEASFDKYFSMMPWLAIPFGNKQRRESLSSLFKVSGVPTVIAIGSDGKTVSTEAYELILNHGAKAFPFTAERTMEIENECSKKACLYVKFGEDEDKCYKK